MWKSFRDELVITSMVLTLTVIASFYIAGQTLRDDSDKKPDNLDVTGDVLGDSKPAAPAVTATPIPQPTIVLQPSPVPNSQSAEATRVPFGIDAAYPYPDYEVVITNPHLLFDPKKSGSRQFIATITIKNISIEAGIDNVVFAKIIKDGNVIVPKASMSVSESKRIFPKQMLTFDIRISLIESTDIAQITIDPEGASTPMIHDINP